MGEYPNTPNGKRIMNSSNPATENIQNNTSLFLTYLPFVIVFGSVFILFVGLCVYFVFVCPVFLKDLSLDTKSPDSDDEEGRTMTTECTSDRYHESISLSTRHVMRSEDNLELRSVQSDPFK